VKESKRKVTRKGPCNREIHFQHWLQFSGMFTSSAAGVLAASGLEGDQSHGGSMAMEGGARGCPEK